MKNMTLTTSKDVKRKGGWHQKQDGGDTNHQIEFSVFLIINLLDGDGNDIMKLNLTWNLVLDADEWYHRIF